MQDPDQICCTVNIPGTRTHTSIWGRLIGQGVPYMVLQNASWISWETWVEHHWRWQTQPTSYFLLFRPYWDRTNEMDMRILIMHDVTIWEVYTVKYLSQSSHQYIHQLPGPMFCMVRTLKIYSTGKFKVCSNTEEFTVRMLHIAPQNLLILQLKVHTLTSSHV